MYFELREKIMKNLEILLEIIKEDYKCFMPDNDMMRDEFESTLRFEEGRKYIKVITNKSVWGFIVNVENDKQFKYGDILKAATWKTPTRNQARGNVVDEDFAWVRWTGPQYL
jgi:hypothetical protein